MNYDKTCFSINGWNDDASNPGETIIYVPLCETIIIYVPFMYHL